MISWAQLPALVARVREILAARPELRHACYSVPGAHPLHGHCYVACEALWHACGRSPDLRPTVLRMPDGGTHWYLRTPWPYPIDPTADQFSRAVDYAAGRGCGFLTKKPSKRAQIVLDLLAL